ncbi:uncharacterized protein BP5553_03722 [Venustampulla echinocandica]|uniref:CFEM domain-containing protein n=1 Tax=Venustampulla echinocandica TaxID=2656787 RepID=A0A370TV21_9HELO|nr:uncharacterized protein BP5553_03722 [Venustampulla echinocandica]RDL39382.1 hypothetical protein BP5553_03722 [Venustampulla echinocandica]
MKFSSTIAIMALAGFTAAAGLDSIPACAKQCIDDAVTKVTTCTTTDVPCSCKNMDKIQTEATPCVLKACGAKAVDVITAVTELCKDGGAAPSSSAAPETSAAPSSSAAAPSSSAEGSSSAAPSSSAAAPTSAAGTGSAPTVISSSKVAAPTNGTSTGTAPPVEVTGAAGQLVIGAGSFVAAGMAVLAAL